MIILIWCSQLVMKALIFKLQIHIDGHSDMVQPFNVEGMPSFTWPRKDQIRLLMQRNDGFIQVT